MTAKTSSFVTSSGAARIQTATPVDSGIEHTVEARERNDRIFWASVCSHADELTQILYPNRWDRLVVKVAKVEAFFVHRNRPSGNPVMNLSPCAVVVCVSTDGPRLTKWTEGYPGFSQTHAAN